MSDALRELYQELILDHNRHPRNHHAMDDAKTSAKGHNPLCGDKLVVYIRGDDEVIEDISFLGQGCAIAQASASLMTEALKGKTYAQAHALFNAFHRMLTEEVKTADVLANLPEKLSVFSGVKAYPARVKCATLAWHTLEAALHQCKDIATTE